MIGDIRCRNCIHWSVRESHWEKNSDGDTHRPCQAVGEHASWSAEFRALGVPWVGNHSQWEEQKTADSIAYTIDGEDYASVLMTRSDFGCVLGELR